ncbi:caspase domain-containing protein [Xylaria arbuscula]|nr:caspase domain-containing protein [Xylaria arbuscula]
MTSDAPNPTRWAIIIGVNYYPSERCLEGCVRDALMIESHLKQADLPVDINILTVETPLSGSSPAEKPEQLPTYHNVVDGLQRILRTAQREDHIYIHYSGHGMKLPNSEELALTLFENEHTVGRCLEGRHLATALNQMVSKGLIVTLVLDCCFSGSVVRQSSQRGVEVRYIDFNPGLIITDPETHEETLFGPRKPLRGAQIEKDWLVDPKGYTVLTACGPYETAYEVDLDGQGRRGALTHFLCATLRIFETGAMDITHHSLHEYLRAQFHAYFPQQTPMRYGNKDLSFFGDLITAPQSCFTSVYRTEDDRICLRTGEVHGINLGDEFALRPFRDLDKTAAQRGQPPRVLRVRAVRPFECELVEVGVQSEAMPYITTGWKAKQITCSSPQKIRVKLAAGIDNTQQWSGISKNLRYMHLDADVDNIAYAFKVTATENKQYSISDAMHDQILGLPTIPVESTDATAKVLRILDHLTTFKYFEGVRNQLPSQSFQRAFSLTPLIASDSGGDFIVSHDQIWGFTIENSSDKPIFMSVYNFNPLWKVYNMITKSGGDSYLVIGPKRGESNGTKTMKLRMRVPETFLENDRHKCEDIIKVFVTSKPISFPPLILPDLPQLGSSEVIHERGTGDLDFLGNLHSQLRGRGDELGEEWATQNFIVRTVREVA